MKTSTGVILGIFGLIVVGFVTGNVTVEHLKTGGLFLAVLGVLVYIHEAGHFLTARRNGVVCHEFGFGFPPRAVGIVKDDETGVYRWVVGNESYHGQNTLFSFNWIPLGGFVRIKGENGTEGDPDSFAVQSIWVRFKILFAGVFMNFILAWVLIAGVMILGSPVPLDEVGGSASKINQEWIVDAPRVMINSVNPESPASEMGLSPGDVVTKVCDAESCLTIAKEEDLKNATVGFKGRDVEVVVRRGESVETLTGTLRAEVSETQGALGVSMADMVTAQYPWHIAIVEGLLRTLSLMVAILVAFGGLLKSLFGAGSVGADVSGPVGIAVMTQQMRDLGLVFIMQFTAILSINLAIINALPIPALDGGRILFLLIEKIKGSPVSPRIEGIIHTVSFTLLLVFMLYITVNDVLRYI